MDFMSDALFDGRPVPSPDGCGLLLALDQWAYLNGVELDFSRPGTPTDNAFIDSLKPSTPASELSVSMPAGSSRWLMPGNGSKRGGSITTPSGLTRPWVT